MPTNTLSVMGHDIDQIGFQYYDGDIKKTTPIGYISLRTFIMAHIEPKDTTMETLLSIQQAKQHGWSDIVKKLKERLVYFTPGAIFNGPRRYENIVRFTGLAQIDIDKIDVDTAIELREELFELYPEMFCVYISPSGTGVKALMKIKMPESIEDYKRTYQAIETDFKSWLPEFDPAPKNLALPLFLSADTKMLWRENAKTWTHQEDLPDQEAYENLTSKIPEYKTVEGDENVYKSDAYYRKITIQIFEKKIRSIVDAGHPQVRSACLVLGSRVGAGYLSQAEAERIAESEIRGNDYLKKGPSGYVKTSRWAINQGIKNPKYYE